MDPKETMAAVNRFNIAAAGFWTGIVIGVLLLT